MPNPENLRPAPAFNSETGRENQKKSVMARKRNKTIAQATKDVLARKITDEAQLEKIRRAGLPIPKKGATYLDYLVAGIVLKAGVKGRPSDLLDLMQVIGEEPETANNSQEDALAQLIDAIKGNKNESEAAITETAGDTKLDSNG